MLNRKGIIFVVSAPSGTGKTTICRRVIEEIDNIRFSVSYTTRPIRKGEIDGRDYYFVNKEKFEELISRGFFVEWANVYGYYYGTPWSELEKAEREGYDILLEIDVQGGVKIKEVFPGSVMIFIVPPSLGVLEERLRKRGRDSEDEIKKRLSIARQELGYLKYYDYVVENNILEDAVSNVKIIIGAERLRRFRLYDYYAEKFHLEEKDG